MGTRNAEAVLREGRQGGQPASPSTSSLPTCIPSTTWARMRSPKDSKLIRSKDPGRRHRRRRGHEPGAAGSRIALRRSTPELLEGCEAPRSRHRLRRRVTRSTSAASRRRFYAMGTNHTSRRYGGAGRRRAVLGRCRRCSRSRRSPIPTATISHWLAEPGPRSRRMKAERRIVPSHGPFGGAGNHRGYRSYLDATFAHRTAEPREGWQRPRTRRCRSSRTRWVAQYPTRTGSPVRSAQA